MTTHDARDDGSDQGVYANGEPQPHTATNGHVSAVERFTDSGFRVIPWTEDLALRKLRVKGKPKAEQEAAIREAIGAGRLPSKAVEALKAAGWTVDGKPLRERGIHIMSSWDLETAMASVGEFGGIEDLPQPERERAVLADVVLGRMTVNPYRAFMAAGWDLPPLPEDVPATVTATTDGSEISEVVYVTPECFPPENAELIIAADW